MCCQLHHSPVLLGTPKVYSCLLRMSSRICDFFYFFIFLQKNRLPAAVGFLEECIRKLSGRLIFNLYQTDGSAGYELTVQSYVYGVYAVLLELQALEVHDEVAGEEGNALGKSNLQVANDGHALGVESYTVLVGDGDAELVVTAVLALEAEAQSKSAGGVDDGELAGEESIESALHAELALIIGGVVAKNSNLNIHGV